MGKSLFRRGFKALEEEKKRQSEYQKNKSGIYRMYLKEGGFISEKGKFSFVVHDIYAFNGSSICERWRNV